MEVCTFCEFQRADGFAGDFESIYDELATTGRDGALKTQIELQVRSYFSSLLLPERPTLYDYLLLSLREKDLIATFNWDPFLAQSFRRNRRGQGLPRLAFLHGNVQIAVCYADRGKGFLGASCPRCGKLLEETKLLYPVSTKDYDTDSFIANEWGLLREVLNEAYMLTIIGYSAPTTDVAAIELMSGSWTRNRSFEFTQVNIVDVKQEQELEQTWRPFFCRDHYGIHSDYGTTWVMRYPRRSCEAFAMATLQQSPWLENPFPQLNSLDEMHAWIAPLVAEENDGQFSGKSL